VVINFDALHDTQVGFLVVQFSIADPLWIIPTCNNRWKSTVEQEENNYEYHTDFQ
jgi:hypothetical protein